MAEIVTGCEKLLQCPSIACNLLFINNLCRFLGCYFQKVTAQFASQPLEITPFRLTGPFRLAYTALTAQAGILGKWSRLAHNHSDELSGAHREISFLAARSFLGRAAIASHSRRDAPE